MAYTRASINLTLDNANADGQTTVFGVGRDWPTELPDDNDLQAPLWTGRSAGIDYVKALGAVGPSGVAARTDMALASWRVNNGLWAESSEAGNLGTKWLHFYDGRPNLYSIGAYGNIQSWANYRPNLFFWMWRFAGDPTNTDPPLLEIHLMGDGTVPEYCIGFPARALGGAVWAERFSGGADDTLKHPYIAAKPKGQSTFSLIGQDIKRRGHGRQMQSGESAKLEAVQFEWDPYLYSFIIRHSDSDEPWVMGGNWLDATGQQHLFRLTDGPVAVIVMGHTVMFSMAQLSYPETVVVEAQRWFTVPPGYNQTPQYATISSVPYGTSVAVAAETASGGRSRPVATFDSGVGYYRPLLLNVMEYRPGTIGNAVSNPISTIGSDTLMLRSADWTLNDKWRGAELNAVIKAAPGSATPEIKHNTKVSLTAAVSYGGATATMFNGFTVPIEDEVVELAKVEARIKAQDGIAARLEHKLMLEHCSYSRWEIPNAFRQILNRGGVPDAKILVHASITLALMGDRFYLPGHGNWGKSTLLFRPDESIVSALDTIVQTRDLAWGIDQDGNYMLYPPVTYSGTPDYTLVQDAVAVEDMVIGFQAAHTTEEFFNVLTAMVGEGMTLAARRYIDAPSIVDPDDAHFIGDDWHKLVTDPEGDDVTALAAKVWAHRAAARRTIYWKTQDHWGLLPDHFVKMQVAVPGVSTDSIYKVKQKRGHTVGDSGRVEHEFEMVLHQEGTA